MATAGINSVLSRGALALATPVAISGVGTRRRGTLSLVVPGRMLVSKGGRLVAVAAAAAATAGAGDDDTREAVVSKFRLEMQVFKMAQRPVAFLGNPTELLEAASTTATDGLKLMECLLFNQPVPEDVYKELVSAGQAFVLVEGQSMEGYVKAEAVVNAIQGLKLIDKIFFDDAKLSERVVPSVPLSGEDVDKESYFWNILNLFVLCYITLYWEAYGKYGFNPRK